jgi:hypothetical protein
MDRISKLRSFLAENPKDDFLNYALAQEYIGLGDDAQAEVPIIIWANCWNAKARKRKPSNAIRKE